VNGHDHGELLDVLSAVPFRPGKPTFVIAHTHKGHPISYMSNNVAWHHRVPDAAEFQQALTELESVGRPRFDREVGMTEQSEGIVKHSPPRVSSAPGAKRGRG
jgi:transketolase